MARVTPAVVVRRVLVGGIFGWLGVGACSGILPGDPPVHSAPVALVAPWDGLVLPIDGGTVTFADADALRVRHVGQTTTELAAAYATALTAAGWTRDADTSAGGVVSQTWSVGDRSVALSALGEGDHVVLALTFLPF